MESLVSIVILTCGKNNYCIDCLDAISKQTYHNLEVILIDNSLELGLPQKAKDAYPTLKTFVNPQNIFYCASMNKGIEMSKGDFILCLNDDVLLGPNFIKEALSGFTHSNNIGMVSGKILRSDGLTLDSTGLFLSLYRTVKERGYGKKDVKQFEKEGFIFGVCGAAAFYRKNMLEEIKESAGYFDPDFRIFYEDLDIAWRANKRGFKGYYVPTALAYHVRGGSLRKNSGLNKPLARAYLSDELHNDLIKNRYLTIIKNENLVSCLLHLLPICLYDVCSWLYVIFFRPKVIKMFILSLGCFPRAISKRRGVPWHKGLPSTPLSEANKVNKK